MKTPQSLLRLFPLALLAASAALAGACSSDGTEDGAGDGDGDGDGDAGFLFCAPANTCPPSIDGVDMDTAVSFREDIYNGFFRDSCGGGSGCHGKAASAAAGLHLGSTAEPLDDAQITSLIAQLLQADTEIAPGQKNVVAGDWQNSWLMAKLDGCQADYGITCDDQASSLILSVCGTACGDGMPASEGDPSNPNPFPKTEAERAGVHKVRAWIQQGAADN